MSISHRFSPSVKNSPIPLTPRELALAHAIAAFWRDHHFAPTMDELRIILGYQSRSTIHRLVSRLETKGWLAPRQSYGSRQIKLYFDPSTHSAMSPAPYRKSSFSEQKLNLSSQKSTSKIQLAQELNIPDCKPREFIVRVYLLQAVQHFEQKRPIKNGTYFAAEAREALRTL